MYRSNYNCRYIIYVYCMLCESIIGMSSMRSTHCSLVTQYHDFKKGLLFKIEENKNALIVLVYINYCRSHIVCFRGMPYTSLSTYNYLQFTVYKITINSYKSTSLRPMIIFATIEAFQPFSRYDLHHKLAHVHNTYIIYIYIHTPD